MKKNLLFSILAVCLVSMMSFSCAVMNAVGEIVAVVGEETDDPLLASLGKATSSVATASSSITVEQEYYIGRSVAASILSQYTILENDSLTKYVNNVCQVLVINSDYEQLYKGYSVVILDTNQINAFATSGGHIFVTRGLLSCVQSEDSLASVIAHEIAHIQFKHGIKAIKSDRWTNAVLASTSVALTALSDGEKDEIIGSFAEGVDTIVSTMVNTGYSKSQEYEADLMALKIMNSAGYNPYSMTEMLLRLQEKQSKSSGGFTTTHPSAKNRLDRVYKELENYTENSIPKARQNRFNQSIKKMG